MQLGMNLGGRFILRWIRVENAASLTSKDCAYINIRAHL